MNAPDWIRRRAATHGLVVAISVVGISSAACDALSPPDSGSAATEPRAITVACFDATYSTHGPARADVIAAFADATRELAAPGKQARGPHTVHVRLISADSFREPEVIEPLEVPAIDAGVSNPYAKESAGAEQATTEARAAEIAEWGRRLRETPIRSRSGSDQEGCQVRAAELFQTTDGPAHLVVFTDTSPFGEQRAAPVRFPSSVRVSVISSCGVRPDRTPPRECQRRRSEWERRFSSSGAVSIQWFSSSQAGLIDLVPIQSDTDPKER